MVYELSGAEPPESVVSNFVLAGSPTSSVSSGLFTTLNPGDFLLGFMGQSGTIATNTATGASWTADLNQAATTTGMYGYAPEYLANSTLATPYNATFTISVPTAWLALAVLVTPKLVPNFVVRSRDPGAVDSGFNIGDVWLDSSDGKLFQCRDNVTGAPKWALLNSALTPKEFGASGLGAPGSPQVDDTAALLNAIRASGLTRFRYAVTVVGDEYLISDGGGPIGGGAGNSSNQVVTLYGSPGGGTFTLTVTVWTPGTGSSTQTTGQIGSNVSGGLLQVYLAALPNIGAGNVTVTGPAGGPYFVTFAAGLNGPVMSATNYLTGGTTPAVGVGDANVQTLTVNGSPSSANITLTVTTATGTQAATINNWTSTTTAATIQSGLAGLTNIGNAVSFTGPNGGPYTISFGPSLAPPAMAASATFTGGTNPSVAVKVIQAGAAIQLSKVLGLRLVGESGSLPDNQSGPQWLNRSSRSSLIWGGSNGGIMMAIDAYQNISIDNLTLSGASNATGNQARIGVIFSDINHFGGTNSTLWDCYLTGFNSPQATANPPMLAACVQFSLNNGDPDGSEGKFFACTFAALAPCVGLRVLSANSVNHQMIACDMYGLDVGVYFQQGGNFQYLGGALEGLNTVLKLGTGNPAALGGGPNASTFILQNLRTEPSTTQDTVLVDGSGGNNGASNIIIEGWDDVQPRNDGTPALRLCADLNVHMRNSVIQRSTPTGLAVEAPGSGPTPTQQAILRLENISLWNVYNTLASLCKNLVTANTKVDVIAERQALQATANITRSDVSTLPGRPSYSKHDWAVLQLNPKNFWRLGEYGTTAFNAGWNLLAGGFLVNGTYVFPLMQNQQRIVITDGIGGFNTRNPVTGNPAGWVSFPASSSTLGILSANAGPTWTLFGVVVRNVAGVYQVIFGNWNGTAGTGGFRIYFAANDSLNVAVDNNAGQVPTPVVATVTGPFAANTPIPFMVQINANSSPNLAIFTGGSTTPTGTASFPGNRYYNDPNVAPLIGMAVGATTPADLQIARIATWDILLAGTDYQALYNAATS